MNEKAIAKVDEKVENTALVVRAEQNVIQTAVAAELPMIPGVDEPYLYRLPRLGKIRIGMNISKDPNTKKPKALDYFLLPDELRADEEFRAALERLGQNPDMPKRLPIMLPCDAIAGNLHSSLDMYGASKGLICRSYDGITRGRVNLETGEIVQGPCGHESCPDFIAKRCQWCHRLRFLLPDAAGNGTWQTDSKSRHSRAYLGTEMMMAKRMSGGKLGGIDQILTVEIEEFHPTVNGKRLHTFNPILHIRSLLSLRKLRDAASDALSYDAGDLQDFDMSPPEEEPAVAYGNGEPEAVPVDGGGRFDAGEEESDLAGEDEPMEGEIIPDPEPAATTTIGQAAKGKAGVLSFEEEAARKTMVDAIQGRRRDLGLSREKFAEAIVDVHSGGVELMSMTRPELNKLYELLPIKAKSEAEKAKAAA